MIRRWVAASMAALVVTSLTLPLAPASAQERAEFANDAFQSRWARTDRPVATGVTQRSWLWGPGPNSIGIDESYADSPGGQRQVQYFDKSRMEINDPNADRDSLWYVTNGRLPVEMITGRIQTGDDQYLETNNPARVPAVGDPDNTFPTYADLAGRMVGARPDEPDRQGQHVTQVLTPGGVSENGPGANDPNAQIVAHVRWGNGAANVPRAFQQFMERAGTIWNGSQYVGADPIIDQVYAYGFPITEPYWTRARVAGVERWVLLQCFERRCLTYTPDNPGDFAVEAGNIGQHYWRWRYGTNPLAGATSAHWSAMTIGSLRDYRNSGSGAISRHVVEAREFNFGPSNADVLRERQTHLVDPPTVQHRYWERADNALRLHGFRRSDGVLVTYDPGIVYLRWPMSVGESWSTTFTERHDGAVQGERTWTFRVEGRAPVTVPAGTFDAYRITITRTGEEFPVETIWFAPNVGVVQSQALEFTMPLERFLVH